MTVVEYRDKFLSLARYSPDEIDTEAKKKERFLNGLHDEMQTVLVNIPYADIGALVDSAIQMEGNINQANENRKRRMMHQPGTHQTPKYRPNPSPGFAPITNRTPMNRPTYPNRGNPRTEGNHNNPSNSSNSTVHHPSSTTTMLPPTPKLPRGLEAMMCLLQQRTSRKRLVMNAEPRVTTPMSAPRRLLKPPMQMPQLSSSIMFSPEEGLP